MTGKKRVHAALEGKPVDRMPGQYSLDEKLQDSLEKIKAWWHRESIGRPCLSFSLMKPGETLVSPQDLNKYWPSIDQEPDLEGLVEALSRDIKKRWYFGESIPMFPYLVWGGRATDSALASFLGGRIVFTEKNVWTKPVIENWENFEFCLDKNNPWLKRSLKLLKLAVEKCNGEYFLRVPEMGDAITILSILRGEEQLLIDLIECGGTVRKARDKIIEIWPKCHALFWKIYSQKFPGDHCGLVWAPGKTFLGQCDISVTISPKMFVEFVVPEIEAMGKHFPYIIWHLDGSDQMKHLDIILDLPQIKAIQWVPTPKDRQIPLQWIPMYKKIQAKGKSLLLYPSNEKEVKVILENLSPVGLFLQGGFTGKTEEEALAYIDLVHKSKRHLVLCPGNYFH